MEFRKKEMVLVVLTLTAAVLHVVLTADQIITAEPGENIILPCRSPDSRPVVLVEWDRDDLWSDYVLVFRDDQIDPDLQHPSFKDRVDLQDRQMKDGDVSLLLNNVMIDDSGTYVCTVLRQGTREKISISTVHLQVPPPPDQNITAEPGQNITLPCRSAASRPVVVVEWDRTDLGLDYVLLFIYDQIDLKFQHPSFKDRVDLQDRNMKDGDVSLVLNNVMIEDSGTYECKVWIQGTHEKISTVHLQVSPPPPGRPAGPGHRGGHRGGLLDGISATGLIVVLVVLALIVLILVVIVLILVVIVIILRRRLSRYHPPHNEYELNLRHNEAESKPL